MTRRSKIDLAASFGYFDAAVARDREAPPWLMRCGFFAMIQITYCHPIAATRTPLMQARSPGRQLRLRVSASMGMSEFYGGRDDRQAIATIHRAIDRGITRFDTADMYGRNEEPLGRAVRSARERLVVATKFGVLRVADGVCLGINGRPDYVRSRARPVCVVWALKSSTSTTSTVWIP
jgi:hypothetical protein